MVRHQMNDTATVRPDALAGESGGTVVKIENAQTTKIGFCYASPPLAASISAQFPRISGFLGGGKKSLVILGIHGRLGVIPIELILRRGPDSDHSFSEIDRGSVVR
jgi:hypothetical protein